MGVFMFSAAFHLVTIGGTIFTARQAFCQDASTRQMVLLSAAVGLTASLTLQAMAGTFSNEDPSKKSLGGKFFSFLVRGVSSVVSGIILPLGIAYGYWTKAADLINKNGFGFVKVEQRVTIGNWDVSRLYPAAVGGNFGFMVGQSIGTVYKLFF